MKLSLSTAASPGVALDTFDAACRARGLDGLELVVEPTDEIEAVVAHVQACVARVVAIRAEKPQALSRLARASAELNVPVSVPPGALTARVARELGREFSDAQGCLLFGFGTDLEQVVKLVSIVREVGSPGSLGLSWELRPGVEDLASSGAVLLAAAEQLRLVRLHGGGPEQHDRDGLGVGPIFVDLAMASYAGPVVLTPSSSTQLPRWSDWLTSRKLAGCGSGHPSGANDVDVRDVEPRDRLGTILGAYEALPRGSTLHITFDHDPSCMQYALEESHPAGSFDFRKIGDGPEVWKAEVTKI